MLLTMGTTAFFEEIRKEEARFGELFTLHFRTKYDEEMELPIWMVTELLSFGRHSCTMVGARQSVKVPRSSEARGENSDCFNASRSGWWLIRRRAHPRISSADEKQ